jgi:hypothetical protein
MVPKLIAAVFCVLLLVGLGAKGLLSSRSQRKDVVAWEDTNSLIEMARRAKAKGEVKVTLPGVIVDYPGTEMTFDEALKDYSVVVAEVVGMKSQPHGSRSIETWYRFQMIDPLSEKLTKYCNTCPGPPEIPEDMPSIGSDEFFVVDAGGALNINGVEITQISHSIPPFEIGKKYLLVVSLTPSRVAMFGAGPAGIFQVAENEKLEAVNDDNYPLQAEVRQRFDGNLTNLKTHTRQLTQ